MKKIYTMQVFTIVLFLQILLVSPLFASASDSEHREGCRICGMYLDVYHRTAAFAVWNDGVRESSCGVADLIRIIDEAGGPDAFQRLVVHDYLDEREVDAKTAVYVIGSDLVPDMLPNIIAFANEESAGKFIADHGGELLTFDQVLTSVSPMGMTMPVRIQSAVPLSKGGFSIGLGGMTMSMDTVKIGSRSEDPSDYIQGKQMGPKSMSGSATMLMAMYGISNRTSVQVKAMSMDRTMEMYMNGGAMTRETSNDGIGDLDIMVRYNAWRDMTYSRFFTVMAGTTLPTGEFDEELVSQPGLQMGYGNFSFSGGLLGSFRVGDFWLHTQASYQAILENNDDFKFGDVSTIGGAVHFTPTYALLLGGEIDGVWTQKSDYQGETITRSGGFRSTATALLRWRFWTVMGGNFNLMLAAGMPLYEDINDVGLGGGYNARAMISFQRRFSDM